MKYVKWIIQSLLFGIVFLFVFNFVGVYLEMNIPINVWTILIVGTLKIPGAIIILIINAL